MKTNDTTICTVQFGTLQCLAVNKISFVLQISSFFQGVVAIRFTISAEKMDQRFFNVDRMSCFSVFLRNIYTPFKLTWYQSCTNDTYHTRHRMKLIFGLFERKTDYP